MLGAHLENLLFLLLLALAGLFQWLGRAARKTSKGEEEPTSKPAAPIPRAPPQSDEERIRKLMEALGQPAASQPRAPVSPRIDVPRRPLAPARSVAEPAPVKTDLAILLASTSGLRDAIVLREIFGPPRSLQPLDLL